MADLKVALEDLKEELDSGRLGPVVEPLRLRGLLTRLVWLVALVLVCSKYSCGTTVVSE
jgi:hypothetical protein